MEFNHHTGTRLYESGNTQKYEKGLGEKRDLFHTWNLMNCDFWREWMMYRSLKMTLEKQGDRHLRCVAFAFDNERRRATTNRVKK